MWMWPQYSALWRAVLHHKSYHQQHRGEYARHWKYCVDAPRWILLLSYSH